MVLLLGILLLVPGLGVADSGPVAYWKLDETSGVSAADSSGNGNTATLVSGPAWTSGKIGGALKFNGATQYVSVPDSPSLRLSAAMTVATWVKVDGNNTDWVRLIGKGDPNNRNYGLWRHPNGDILFQIYNSGATQGANFWSNAGPGSACNIAAESGWRHVAATYDGNTCLIYIDGVQVYSGTQAIVPATNAAPATLGYAGYAALLNGALDDVQIFNRALSATDVAAMVFQGGFEQPNVGPAGSGASYKYNPTGSVWSFAGCAGLAANGSAFTGGNPNAPEGVQVAFLQGYGTVSQTVKLNAGNYAIQFLTAQRTYGVQQVVRVSVDGQSVGDFTPVINKYNTYVSGTFSVAAGSHTITFAGIDPSGGDATAFIDNVRLVLAPNLVAAASVSASSAYAGQSVTLAVSGSDPAGGALTYSWDFGDGTTGSGNSVAHSYASPGTYTATVTISNAAGVKTLSSITITITSIADFFFTGSNGHLWMSRQNNNSSFDTWDMGDGIIGNPVVDQGNQIWFQGANGHLWMKRWGNGWGDPGDRQWHSFDLGYGIAGDPVVDAGDQAWFRGTNGHLWMVRWGNGWSDPGDRQWHSFDMGDAIAGKIAITPWCSMQFQGANGHLWYKAWAGTGWSTWDMGDAIAGSPAVSTDGYDYFSGTNGHLWIKYWTTDGVWHCWDMGDAIAGNPSVNRNGVVYFRGANGHLWRKWWDRDWITWDMGDVISSDPVATTDGVLFKGLGGHEWLKWWSAGTWYSADLQPGVPKIYTGGVEADTWLHINDALTSPNGMYRLIVQSDGNVVVYDNTGKGVWWTDTCGCQVSGFVMQSDGNLVLYDTNGHAPWYSNTCTGRPALLVLTDNGEVQVLDATTGKILWRSKGNQALLLLDCYKAGTPIMTQRGLVAIENVVIGDLAFSRNVDTGEYAFKPVYSKSAGWPQVSVRVTTGSGRSIECTPESFLLTYGGNFTQWKSANSITPGMYLVNSQGWGDWVSSVQVNNANANLFYWLEVEDFHTLCIGDTGLVVHNGYESDAIGGLASAAAGVAMDAALGPAGAAVNGAMAGMSPDPGKGLAQAAVDMAIGAAFGATAAAAFGGVAAGMAPGHTAADDTCSANPGVCETAASKNDVATDDMDAVGQHDLDYSPTQNDLNFAETAPGTCDGSGTGGAGGSGTGDGTGAGGGPAGMDGAGGFGGVN
jgi:PKD repeat protein